MEGAPRHEESPRLLGSTALSHRQERQLGAAPIAIG